MATRTECNPLTVPPGLRISHELHLAISTWSTSQRAVIGLAADFADSGEWAVTGAVSAAHWIAAVADIEVCTAREWIRVGKQLRSLPIIAALFEADELSYSKVRTLSRIVTPANEAPLSAIAKEVPAGQLARAIASWLHRTSDACELEHHQHEQRSVTWRSEPDGMVTISARLPPLVAGMLISRLTTHVMSARRVAVSVDQWPSLAQQHADALEHLLREGTGGLLTELILHVRAAGATLDDGTALPMSVIERIAPEAFIRALIHDTEGRPINASSRQRHPSTRQKRVVKERDQMCVDCGAASLLQYDHVPEFEVTHHTVVEELQLRCAPCHQRRHQHDTAA
ncbi:MAG: DUF222 domain-containing protein [Actinomycetota bacterium]|nr:DUF222 domain-containing protein [Actinomycetota bacterium]